MGAYEAYPGPLHFIVEFDNQSVFVSADVKGFNTVKLGKKQQNLILAFSFCNS
jgi:hypothetical protein